MVHQIHEKDRARCDQGSARRCSSRGRAPARSTCWWARPAELIAKVAGAGGVEGIVMGTRGMGPIKSLVLGSVATKVIHLVEFPVTLVK